MNWICCQLGAREHYAIPRALSSQGLLDSLLTDAWVSPSSFLAKIPGRSLADRFHDDLSDARVIAFNSSAILFEMFARARRHAEWNTIIQRNQWFQHKVIGALTSYAEERRSVPPILLSYSYAALEPFRFGKLRGWKTVLVQIDPGPEEERIVAEEVARAPELAGEWQAAPSEYWAGWRQECEFADRIIVNSEWSQEGLARVGISAEKIISIPLAYDQVAVGDHNSEVRQVRSYPTRFTQDRPMRVLFLGQVNLRKGIARLLRVADMLRDEPVEFWMVGPVQIAITEAAEGNARVKWFGQLTRNETAGKYRAADIFILPTLSDGFAITQLEAQAHALPVIASKYCGSVVENGRNGIILEEPTVACIATAVRDCIANPDRLQRMAAESYVRNQFTTAAIGHQLRDLGSNL